MMADLFDPPPVHKDARDTEHAAADMARGYVATDRQRVLDALGSNRRMTATEIAELLGWPDVYRARRRLSDLANARLVRDTGERAKTRYGRPEIVWQAVAGPHPGAA